MGQFNLLYFSCTAIILLLNILSANTCLYCPVKPIESDLAYKCEQHERLVIFQNGMVKRPIKGPGMVTVWCCQESEIVDIRTMSIMLPQQDVLTKDSVSAIVDAAIFYRIADPIKALTKIENYKSATQILAVSALRNVVGTRSLSEVMVDRERMSTLMHEILEASLRDYGMLVENIELTEIRLPESLQRAMAAEAEADRYAKAKIIAASAEVMAAKALAEAANTMSGDPLALQLRYLQSLSAIATKNETTVIFPFPMNLLSSFPSVMGGPPRRPVTDSSSKANVLGGPPPRPVTDSSTKAFASSKVQLVVPDNKKGPGRCHCRK